MPRRLAPLLLILSSAVAWAGPEDARPATEPAGPQTAKAETTDAAPADWADHDAGDSGVTLKAPKEWTKGPQVSPNVKLMLLIGGGNSMNLVVVPAGPGETLEAIFDTVPKALGRQFVEYDLIKTEYVKLGDQPAARVEYTAVVQKGQPKLHFCQYFVNKNGKDYVLTYTAFPTQYDKLLKTAQQVAASVKVP